MIVLLATALVVRDDCVLLVASRYPNQPRPLWNLPGGRQQAGELLTETAERETFEETGMRVVAGSLAYVSESYDGPQHFINVTFHVTLTPKDPQPAAASPSDHVVEVAWIPIAAIAQRVSVAVVREPLLDYLNGRLDSRYAGFHEAGITIEWPPDSS